MSSATVPVVRLPIQLNLVSVRVCITWYLYTYCKKATYPCLLSAHASVFTANRPRVTTHPQEMKDAVPGKPVRFTTVATGIQPLSYQWEWKPPSEASPENEMWQPCSAERFPGAENSTITIPSVQKSNEGSYRCVVSNCAGSQTSNPAELSVGKSPMFTAYGRKCIGLKSVVTLYL